MDYKILSYFACLCILVEDIRPLAAGAPDDVCRDVWAAPGPVNCYGVVKEYTVREEGDCTNISWIDCTIGIISLPNNMLYCADIDIGGTPAMSVRIPESERLPVVPGNIFQCSSPSGVAVFRVRLDEGAPPRIDNLDNSITVFENDVISGPTIFTVHASHQSSSPRLPGGQKFLILEDLVTFTFTTAPPTPFTFIQPDPQQGILMVQVTSLLNYELESEYVINVTVRALDKTDTGQLIVHVLDRNDKHVLTNLYGVAAVSILDNCISTPIFTVDVWDEDDPTKYPIKNFYVNTWTSNALQPISSPFRVNKNTEEVTCTGDLATWQTGMGTQYNLSIVVSDGWFKVEETLTINIEQTIDPPIITNLPTAVHNISEDHPLPYDIYDVAAFGPYPADIRFTIEDVYPRKYIEYFAIDALSGRISLTSAAVLDYAIQRNFTVTVGVRDKIQVGISQNLTLNLTWVNQEPIFSPDEYTLTIPEQCNYMCNGTYPGSWPIPDFLLRVIDRDFEHRIPTNRPDNISCSIMPGFGANYFTTNCFQLIVKYPIDIDDYPQNMHMNISVQVKDVEGLMLTHRGDIARIYINVTDLNDNAPVFHNTPYEATIVENTHGVHSLLTVTATDKDRDLNGEVRYYMVDYNERLDDPDFIDTNSNLHFEVDELSGEVHTKQFVDREAIHPSYLTFYVVARDRGTPAQTSQVKVVVHVQNVNDKAPRWLCQPREFEAEYVAEEPCFYDYEMRADTAIGYQVVQIQSVDADTWVGDISYHLLKPSNYFTLASSTGEIELANYLSPYVKHILYCYSQDNGDPNLESAPHLRVRIDTYDPRKQLVDITLGILKDSFTKARQTEFLAKLRAVISPWFPKIEVVGIHKDKTVVSVYALRDNSTFDENNLPKAKQFVHRNELLQVLRKNIKGTPRDVLETPEFSDFDVISVEPTYSNWFLDTIPGIITLTLILLALLGMAIGLGVGMCYRNNQLCFNKPRPEPRPARPPPSKKTDDYKRIDDKNNTDRQKPRQRRVSVDTIHSLIYTAPEW